MVASSSELLAAPYPGPASSSRPVGRDKQVNVSRGGLYQIPLREAGRQGVVGIFFKESRKDVVGRLLLAGWQQEKKSDFAADPISGGIEEAGGKPLPRPS